MQNISKFLSLVVVVALFSCNKEKDQELTNTNHDQTSLIDWASGQEIQIISTPSEIVADRTADVYLNYMYGATSSFGYQGDLYRGTTFINSTPWYWVNAYTSAGLGFSGDDSNEYTLKMHYQRGVQSVPCTITTYWSSNCSGSTSPTTWTIGTGVITKTHVFMPCQ